MVLGDVDRDDHGHISLGKLDLGKLLAEMVTRQYLPYLQVSSSGWEFHH